MGGPSSEHEVSLATGQNVFDNLDRSKYEPVRIFLSKNNEWHLENKKMSESKALDGCDIVFNALHGTFGEDGRIQSLLEYFGKPYTGSGIIASGLAMDKLRSREIFRLAGYSVPKTLKIRKGENYSPILNIFVTKIVDFPVVVKPCSNGSSVGVSVVSNREEFDKAIKAVFKIDKKILVEEFISGTEATCGVIDGLNGQQPTALPVTEIVPLKNHKFFDYKAKYKSGHSDEITPARFSDDITGKIQQIAVGTHQILGCRAYSRTDFIVSGENIFVLEVNTLPGLTSNSLLPKAAEVAGLNFKDLLNNIIKSSLI